MPSQPTNVITILKKTGAVIENSHFVFTSGKHGDIYINKDTLYPYTQATSQVCLMIAKLYKNKAVDVVVAPAVGGTILSQWVAYHLSRLKKKEVFSAYTEKDKGTLASAAESDQLFRRGYDQLVKNKKVLVLEDLTTTGMSVKKVVTAVKKAKGKVVGVCVMVNRDPKHVTSKLMGAPFKALATFPAQAWDEADCPLCKKGIPINTTVGHGKQFLEQQKQEK